MVAFGYTKFFNYGEETRVDDIDWGTARVTEKLDGTLILLYYYDDAWQVATTGRADASGEVSGAKKQQTSFADLFWSTFRQLGYRLPTCDGRFCYLFELMTRHNQVVVKHEKPRIVLHGIREVGVFPYPEHLPEPFAAEYGWEVARTFPLSQLSEVLAACEPLEGTEAEGFVVTDQDFHRLKVKAASYVRLAHLKGRLENSRDNLLEVSPVFLWGDRRCLLFYERWCSTMKAPR